MEILPQSEATWDGGSEVVDPSTGLLLYPNPAEQEFHLVLPQGEKGSYEIFDLNGKRVAKGDILGGDQGVSTKGVPKGMYLVKTIGSSTSVRKIAIQ
jgi:Secretion system C-terminal sorting domain